MSIFTCCERLDESKYLHTCACPVATLTCESEQTDATLCGWEEAPDGAPSGLAAKKYIGLTKVASGIATNTRDCFAGEGTYVSQEVTSAGSEVFSANPDSGCTATHDSGQLVDNYITYNCFDDVVTESGSGSVDCNNSGGILGYSNWYSTNISIDSTIKVTRSGGCRSGVNVDDRIVTVTLSSEDTETAALARADPPVVGTSCSSIWQVRSTGFSWTVRTSGYTIECDDLVIGVEYEVTPAIRIRTAVIGSFGAWEDVAVTPVVFTATSTTETIDNGGDPIELDNLQGFEYEITSVNIEKKA